MTEPRTSFSTKTAEVSHLYVDETGYHEVRVASPKRIGLPTVSAVFFAALEWLFG